MRSLVERVRQGTPLVVAMELTWLDSSDHTHRFHAPFDRCRNQLGVGFGGAIATGLTLAGWFAFTQACEQAIGKPCNPVVAKSSQKFIAPFRDADLIFLAPVIHVDLQPGRIRQHVVTQLLDQAGILCAEAELDFVL